MNQPRQANLPEYSVSEISAAVKRVVEDNFGYVRVRGEISGYRGPHSSGHAYFTLKDERARMEAVVWKTTLQRIRFKPQEGLEVVATGRLTTFPGSSKYQIVIDALEPAGVGALMALVEERRKKLAAEGLFEETRKKALPYLPRIIGVVTSPTGAVIRDILHRLADRCPARVLVWPVRVQGETSAFEVTAAIEGFNRMTGPSRPDVLIVARGGGSLEDLWSFNEEAVVRAAAASLIPLISAIGHETDFTLIDFAADKRAPTPTAAAEMAVPVRTELLASLDSLAARHLAGIARRIDRDRKEVRAAARALPSAENLLAIPRRTFDELSSRLGRGLIANARAHRVQFERAAARLSLASIGHMVTRCRERASVLAARAWQALERRLERKRAQLDSVARALPLVSYRDILARGFAVVRAGGVPVRSTAAVPPGTRLDIELHDGHVGATVEGAGGRKKTPGGTQGSLF
jgi:exodeoxyribonuclease VII large subunit